MLCSTEQNEIDTSCVSHNHDFSCQHTCCDERDNSGELKCHLVHVRTVKNQALCSNLLAVCWSYGWHRHEVGLVPFYLVSALEKKQMDEERKNRA